MEIPGCSSLNLRLLPVGSSADQTATILALDATCDTDVLVPDEAPDDVHPAIVPWQIFVKLLCDLADGGKTGPRDSGEIVVLVVQTNIVRKPVERPVVGECLGDGDVALRVALLRGDALVDVVLCDEVAGEGVKAASEEAGEKEVEDRFEG